MNCINIYFLFWLPINHPARLDSLILWFLILRNFLFLDMDQRARSMSPNRSYSFHLYNFHEKRTKPMFRLVRESSRDSLYNNRLLDRHHNYRQAKVIFRLFDDIDLSKSNKVHSGGLHHLLCITNTTRHYYRF